MNLKEIMAFKETQAREDNKYGLNPKSKRNPVYVKGFENGRQVGYEEAIDIFHKFIMERMNSLTKIKGIGDTTAWKIHEHFIKGIDGVDTNEKM